MCGENTVIELQLGNTRDNYSVSLCMWTLLQLMVCKDRKREISVTLYFIISHDTAHTTGLLSDCFCDNSAMLSCITLLMLCQHISIAITSTLSVAGLSTLETAFFFRKLC